MWNYSFKLFVRNLFKHKFLSFFNVLGLGVAMGAFLLILHYVRYEHSFDKFHADHDRLYRLIMTREVNGEFVSKRANTYPAMEQVIASSYPGIEATTKIMYSSRGGVLTTFETPAGEILRDDLKTLMASPSFINVFSLDIIKGDFNRLNRPFMAMISDRLASQLFGENDAVGSTFKEDDGRDYLIVGVYEKWEGNSHLDFDLIKSYSSIGARFNSSMPETSWDWDRMKTYVKLSESIDPQQFEQVIEQVVNENRTARPGVLMNETISIQPVADIRMHSDFEAEGYFEQSANKVSAFLLIGITILVMGWMNFVNLSIARGLDRTKEVGIQKVAGATRKHLIVQHLAESFQVNFIAFALATSLYQILLPELRDFVGIPESYSDGVFFYLWLILGLVAGSVFSGLYQALILSKVQILSALKNKMTHKGRGIGTTRSALSAIQFAISIALVMGVTTIYRQLDHMRSIELGTKIDGILVVRQPRDFNYETFSANPDVIKNEWKEIPGVMQVASSYAVPGGNIYPYEIRRVGQPESANVLIPESQVDHNFLGLYELEFVAGRDFSREIATDDSAAVINETALKMLGFSNPEEALGKRITSPENEFIRHIVGVIKDFHQLSPANAKQPLLFALDTESRGFYSIQFNTNNLSALQASVEATFSEVFPGNIFHSFFLDDYYNEQYAEDEQLGTLLAIFATVAVILAAMGLISMTYFSVVKRMKEMSIRKVLGADFKNLIGILTLRGNMNFILGATISIPVVYYLLSGWLASYQARIKLGLFDFGLPLISLYLLALIAMVLVMLRVLNSNPTDTLREE